MKEHRPFGLLRLTVSGLRRSWRRLTAAAAGIALGAAILTFFLGLVAGVEETVVGKLVPRDCIEVGRGGGHVDLGPLRIGLQKSGLDEDDLERIGDIEGVGAVWAKTTLGVPAVLSGGRALAGQDVITETAVWGVAAPLAGEGTADISGFQARPPVGPGTVGCVFDGDCPDGEFCVDSPERRNVCRPPLPVVVSSRLIGLYEGVLRKAYGLPRINPDSVVGLGAEIRFGASSLGRRGVGERELRDRVRLVGFSDRVGVLGVSAPLEEILRLNLYFSGGGGNERPFQTAVVQVESGIGISRVVETLRRLGYRIENPAAVAVGHAVAAVRAVMTALGLAVMLVAVFGVAQTFALLIESRRQEIGILRAVGASRRAIVRMLVGEGAVVGLGGAVAGVALANVFGIVVDRGVARVGGIGEFLGGRLVILHPGTCAVIVAVTILWTVLTVAVIGMRGTR